MENAPPPFEKFIGMINQEKSKDLVKHINLFMKEFRGRPPDAEADSKYVQDFMSFMEQAFSRHPLWAGCSPEDLEAAVEGLEKYLMTKLFDRTFSMDPTDKERDHTLTARLHALQFVRPEHLEALPELNGDSTLALAQKELKKLNMFKSPRDKLVCILNCCRVVNNLLATRKGGSGADDFTPVLIFVTIKAQPETLASNLAFIERYRMTSRLASEALYFFVQMQGAAAFIETLSTSSLVGVDPDELLAHMLAAGAISEGDLAAMTIPAERNHLPSHPQVERGTSGGDDPAHDPGHASTSIRQEEMNLVDLLSSNKSLDYSCMTSSSQKNLLPPPPPPPPPHITGQASQPSVIHVKSSKELEAEGLRLVLEAESRDELRERHSFLYSNPEGLTLANVGQLLVAYKELVIKYESLQRGVDSQAQQGLRTSLPELLDLLGD